MYEYTTKQKNTSSFRSNVISTENFIVMIIQLVYEVADMSNEICSS